MSTLHLSRAFSDYYGRSLTDYVRGRRLSLAAESLARGAPDILELVLASGYGSHEAFSRAFKAMLGLTPEVVRRRATVDVDRGFFRGGADLKLGAAGLNFRRIGPVQTRET